MVNFEHASLPENFVKTTNFPFWVGFFDDDFHVKIAQQVLLQTDTFEHECWRPYGPSDKAYQKNINGVKHRLFPSKILKIGRFGPGDYSPQLLKELKSSIRQGNVIVSVNGSHGHLVNQIMKLKNYLDFPLIIQHRGGWFSYFKFMKNPNVFHLLRHYYEMYNLINQDFYFSQSRKEIDFLRKKAGIKKTFYIKDGIDYDFFYERDKMQSRQKLNLSKSSKIILYVGRLNNVRGVESLLNAVNNLQQSQDIQLVLVGGYKSDSLYKKCIDQNHIVIDRIQRDDLVNYYNAADFSIMPSPDPYISHFSGFPNVVIESLACNRPVISDNLYNFPGKYDEMKLLGLMPRNFNNLELCIEKMIKSYNSYSKCMVISKKRFDSKFVIKKNILAYKYLKDKYNLQ